MIIDSIVLGIVQGFTEFLPISSSGHLILFRLLMGGAEGEGAVIFDVAVHLVTALVIAIYFYKDIVSIIKSGPSKWLLIIVGIIPAGLAGYFFGDVITSSLRSVSVVIVMLLIGSLIMALGEYIVKKGSLTKQENNFVHPNAKNIFIMGLFQVLALIPGTSRSGSTIAGGLIAGLNRKTAATYSFLLGLPLILGAGALKFLDVYTTGEFTQIDSISLIAGSFAALVSGFIAIHFFMKIVSRRTLWPFIYYRVVLAGLLIIVVMFK